MGRRALRKIDPALDLSGHLTPIEQLAQPFDAAALFGRSAPLEIEIGSGKGLFLATAAASHPDRNFLGIELSRKYARFAAARLAKTQRRNARVIHGDAKRFFQELLADRCAAAVHLYFPDPWWKKRHQKRRVINDGLLRHVERTLEAGGRFHFWTDVQDYFQTTVQLILSTTALQGPFDVPETPAKHDLDYRTHFERRMRLHHVAVYRAEFRK